MKRFRWSLLYPRSWRREFGDEFDAMMEMRTVHARDVFDIAYQALRVRLVAGAGSAPILGAWCAIAWFNMNAHEVQWPAGVLLVSAAGATFFRPKKWAPIALGLASAVPISTLLIYQVPGPKHEPLYHTAVALIPALVGCAIGAAFSALRTPEDGQPA